MEALPAASDEGMGRDDGRGRSSVDAAPPDWLFRAFAARPVSPVVCALGLFGLHFAVSAGLRLVYDGWAWLWLVLDALNSLLFAIVPAIIFVLQRAAMRDVRSLEGSLRSDARSAAVLAERIVRIPRGRLFGTCGLLALYFASMPVYDPTFYGELGDPTAGSGQVVFFVIRSAIMGFFVGHAVASEIWTTALFHQIGARDVAVDLHQLDALGVFARRGLRSAFAWTLTVSLVTLFWLASAAGVSNAVIIGVTLVLVGIQAVWSMAGVRGAIQRAKQARLAAIDARIGAEADANLAAAPGAGIDARLANLVAYRRYVADVREWPFGGAAVLRFALVAALGLGSWLGGALVERGLDALLR